MMAQQTVGWFDLVKEFKSVDILYLISEKRDEYFKKLSLCI